MKRFTFELESVLSLREQEEQRAMQALAGALRALSAAQAEADALTEKITQAQMRDLHAPADHIARQLYVSRLEGVLVLRRAVIADLQETAAHARADAAEAQARREAVSRLKARRREEWELENQRAEQSVLDDTGSQAYHRAMLEHAKAGPQP